MEGEVGGLANMTFYVYEMLLLLSNFNRHDVSFLSGMSYPTNFLYPPSFDQIVIFLSDNCLLLK